MYFVMLYCSPDRPIGHFTDLPQDQSGPVLKYKTLKELEIVTEEQRIKIGVSFTTYDS